VGTDFTAMNDLECYLFTTPCQTILYLICTFRRVSLIRRISSRHLMQTRCFSIVLAPSSSITNSLWLPHEAHTYLRHLLHLWILSNVLYITICTSSWRVNGISSILRLRILCWLIFSKTLILANIIKDLVITQIISIGKLEIIYST